MKETKIYIEIAGGGLFAVHCSDPLAKVFLIDHDNGEADEEQKSENKELLKEMNENGCKIVF